MTLSRAAIRLYRREGASCAASMRTAVSLHGHSECSREKLTFIPGLARRLPIVAGLFDRSLARYQREHGRPLDFNDAYWRPPLAPAEVIESERGQIARRFNCDALVSLTDHDTLEGPRALRAGGMSVPLSVEWSVPTGGTTLHLGVHGISPARVDDIEPVLAAYTAGSNGNIAELLAWLDECPETFIILNHPYWDLAGVGALRHEATLLAFLRAHRHRIHAIELNGYRPWSENRRVLPLAEGFGLPLVGGGDRHGHAPNSIVNLTGARCLAEFAHDLRAGEATCCVVLPEYEEPIAARVLQTAAGVLADLPEHARGRRRWTDRVFIEVDGVEHPLEAWWTGVSWWFHGTIAMTRLLGWRAWGPLFELARGDGHPMLAPDCQPDVPLGGASLFETHPAAVVHGAQP